LKKATHPGKKTKARFHAYSKVNQRNLPEPKCIQGL